MLPTTRSVLVGFSHWRALVACLVFLTTTFTNAAVINTAQPFIGVTYYQIIEAEDGSTLNAGLFNLSRPVAIHIMEIDPKAEGVSFLMQPDNGSKPGEVTRTTTSDFVDSVNAQIGINADFYSSAGSGSGEYYANVTHTGVSNGVGYSSSNYNGQSIFNVSQDNIPYILTAAGRGTFETQQGIPLYNALGGNQRIVTNGVETAPNDSYTNALNPHTALGVTYDGKVILMTVDGRQPQFSEGMRTDEMADLLIDYFNVKDAINVDGGGSTTMVMDDRDDGFARARVLNSPSDGSSTYEPGYERLVANNFAVFATPNPDYVPLAQPARPKPPGAQPFITDLAIFDDFEATKGHFTNTPSFSASSHNVAASSTATLDSEYAQDGQMSLRLDIDNTNQTPESMQLRLVSGTSHPLTNLYDEDKAMSSEGYVGLFLRLEPGNDPLYISMLLDDGIVTNHRQERAAFQKVIADGKWHLYQWDLSDSSQWENYNGGNHVIDGPNAFIDSLYFSSAPATTGGSNWSGTVWIDTIAYNPDGDLSSLIPEPSSMILMLTGIVGLNIRRKLS